MSAVQMPISPPISLHKWVAENEGLLQPPVNNFCLYSGNDFIVMVIGGPNERSDYHINETEVRGKHRVSVERGLMNCEQEWFYQYKGAMLLRLVADEVFIDVPIQEGEIFLLPRT